MVVFGSISRYWCYARRQSLFTACKALNIKEIHDVGPKQFGPSAYEREFKDNGINLFEYGVCQKEKVSGIIASSIFGFFDSSRFPGRIGKSCVYAAYSAHRLVPVANRANTGSPDGLFSGKHYLSADKNLRVLNLDRLQSIADNSYAWYVSHNKQKTLEVFASKLLSGN
jgi:hypothetical protein